MPSSVVWSSALRKRGLRNVTIAALPRRSIEAPGNSMRPSLTNLGSSACDSGLGSSIAWQRCGPDLLAAQHRREEQALVDFQPGLLALPQAVLGGDVLRCRHQAGKLPRRRFHQFVDPHEARAVVGQRVIDRIGMLTQEPRPRLAGAIADIARSEPRGRQRFRQTRLVVVHSGTPSAAPGRVHVARAAATIAMTVHRIDLA